MHLLVPDAIPCDLLPELDSRRLDLSLDDLAAIDDARYLDAGDDSWHNLRRYELDPAWHEDRD
jgi:hypothetical protein